MKVLRARRGLATRDLRGHAPSVCELIRQEPIGVLLMAEEARPRGARDELFDVARQRSPPGPTYRS